MWVMLGLAGCPSDPSPQVWEFDVGRADAVVDKGTDRGTDGGRADAAGDAALDMRIPTPMPDRGTPDAVVLDAAFDAAVADASPDVRMVDAAMPDMRAPDASPPDMRMADASPLDMRIPDASPPDMRAPDAALPDMRIADAAVPDMAEPDAMPDMIVDAAPPDPMARPPAGFCAPVRPEGWACFNDDRACQAGLTCIDGTCSAPSPFEGPCDGNADCVAGQQLYCARYSDAGAVLQQPFCRQRGAIGEACHRRNFGCDFGLVCVLDICRERSQIGGPCQTSGDCVLEAWCEVNGLCAAYIPLGEPCNPQAPGCEPGLVCTDEVCAERAPPGEGCQHAGQCAIGQYCDRFDDSGDRRENGVCTPRQREGDPCDARETSVCNASVCLEGLCVADQPEEGACQSSFDCEAGFWCPRAF
jgi:hypothetical protein